MKHQKWTPPTSASKNVKMARDRDSNGSLSLPSTRVTRESFRFETRNRDILDLSVGDLPVKLAAGLGTTWHGMACHGMAMLASRESWFSSSAAVLTRSTGESWRDWHAVTRPRNKFHSQAGTQSTARIHMIANTIARTTYMQPKKECHSET